MLTCKTNGVQPSLCRLIQCLLCLAILCVSLPVFFIQGDQKVSVHLTMIKKVPVHLTMIKKVPVHLTIIKKVSVHLTIIKKVSVHLTMIKKSLCT